MTKSTSTKRAYRAVVLKALPGTQADIRARTGLSLGTVSRWVASLCDDGEAHVGDWYRTPKGGPFAEVIFPGAGKTPPRPAVVGSGERTRVYRKRMRASGEWEDVKARNRGAYHAARIPKPDPLAALFGAA